MGNSITVPHSSFIPGGITFSNDVLISGVTFPNSNRFSVNLCAGPTWDSDTAFTFNPRLNDGKVVRNHKQGGSWGLEEVHGGMPFSRGCNFEIYIKVEQQGFKVSVNNKHFCNFHHRIPKERVQYIYIEGDVAITFIKNNVQTGISGRTNEIHKPSKANRSIKKFHEVEQITGRTNEIHKQSGANRSGNKFHDFAQLAQFSGGSFDPPGNMAPPPYPGLPSYPDVKCPEYSGASHSQTTCQYPGYPIHQAGPMFNPPVPLVTPISGGLHPGKIIYISGIPKHNPGRFTVNLACGAHDAADMVLTFDVRFNFGNSKNVVVRTHRENNKYGHEERHQTYFPFYPGVSFDMMILAEPSCFKIAVNNQHFTEFMHRIQPFQKATYLNIVEDVQITQVRFH